MSKKRKHTINTANVSEISDFLDSSTSSIPFPPHNYLSSTLIDLDLNHPNHHISTASINQKHYAGDYHSVYEYSLPGNVLYTVRWEYTTGWVHITPLWQAMGNAKADVLKLIESSPEIAPLVRRTKGGCLAIQGTWIHYYAARKLAARFSYSLRYALVPLFGNDFPSMCLKPTQIGYGLFQLRLTDKDLTRKKRKRRKFKDNNNSCNNYILSSQQDYHNNTDQISPSHKNIPRSQEISHQIFSLSPATATVIATATPLEQLLYVAHSELTQISQISQ
jgi:hypothetical protein